MQITTNQFKRCDLVKASGRIDSSTAPQLAEAFKAINDAGRFKIVFDMSELEFMSSAGLRVLIDTQKTCRRWNRGEIVLAGVPPNIHKALELVGLVPIFRFYDDATVAVGTF